jgi:hypothetical protein
MDKHTEHFTEEDKLNLIKLQPEEHHKFMARFAEIAMRRRIADDVWDTEMNEIGDIADALVKDIKEALAKVA